ncbi:MAG: hypothetical protein Kow0090_12400 [Myxococcota bacterium]
MKILLSSVFGPFGVDDEFGRKENIVELFHNQVTREQGLFSIRMHHQSFGLYFIAENIKAPTVVLDFPTQERFIKEIKKGYDYVGISFIVPNFAKARRMAELVRLHSPASKIVLGGHGTAIPNIENMIEHDHICKGEGVKWFRELLGEDPDAPFKHPAMFSASFKRIMGIPIKTDSAVVIPGVGCVNGCRFCATSHFFDKTYTSYLSTGKAIFDVCQSLEKKLGVQEFFVMDENFLKNKERAEELVSLLEQRNKTYRFGIFSSAETIKRVGVPFLARLGVHFLWIGVESKREIYEKMRGVDPKALIREMRDHGICVLASGILFLERHDKESILEDIEYIVGLEADYVQFMQLGPLPGTKLFDDYNKKGLLRKEVPFEEWHGQHRIWFHHPNFSPEESEEYLRNAFKLDYDRNGPSLLRNCETIIRGCETLERYDDPFMKARRELMLKWATDYRKILKTIKKRAHTDHIRSLADGVITRYDKALGKEPAGNFFFSKAAEFFAARELARINARKQIYQPKTCHTEYRMSVKDLIARTLEGKDLSSLLHLDIHWNPDRLVVTMGGYLDKCNAKTFARQLRRYLKKEEGEVILKIEDLISIEEGSFQKLLKRVKKYEGRVKIYYDSMLLFPENAAPDFA